MMAEPIVLTMEAMKELMREHRKEVTADLSTVTDAKLKASEDKLIDMLEAKLESMQNRMSAIEAASASTEGAGGARKKARYF